MRPAGTPQLAPAPGAGSRAAIGPQWTIAGRLCGAVLGAGLLVMPPVVAALSGADSLLVWAAHILLGTAVSLVLALLVRARVGPASLGGAVGSLLGGWAQRAVDGAFAVAFTAGQAAIAWFAATGLLAAGSGALPRPGAAGALLALGILAVAVLAALSPLSPPAVLLRLRPWAAATVALAAAAMGWPPVPAVGSPTTLAPAGFPPGGALWLALAALFFAGVGWEAVTSVVPAVAAGPRRTAAGVLLGAGGVAVVYLGLAAVQRVGAATPAGPPPAALRWALAVATTVVLISYCFTNVRTAARIAARVWDGVPTRGVVAAVGLACGAFACWGAAGDGGVPLLLLGPAAAAVLGYSLAAAAAVRHGGPLLRWAGAAVLVVLVGTAALAVPVLLSS